MREKDIMLQGLHGGVVLLGKGNGKGGRGGKGIDQPVVSGSAEDRRKEKGGRDGQGPPLKGNVVCWQ